MDKVIITFNYKDGIKTMNLDNIKGSDLENSVHHSDKAIFERQLKGNEVLFIPR